MGQAEQAVEPAKAYCNNNNTQLQTSTLSYTNKLIEITVILCLDRFATIQHSWHTVISKKQKSAAMTSCY